MKGSKYYKKKFKGRKNNNDHLSLLFTQFLLAIIFLLSSLILTNLSSDFKSKYQKEVLEKNLDFPYLNKLYKKYIGEDKKEEDTLVANVTNNNNSYEKVGDATKFLVNRESPINSLEGGIIVFIGDKDNLGNTVIIQGNDGVDIWYSNIDVTEYSLYDYISKGAIIGVSQSDNYLITIKKDDKTINYEDYIA